GRDRSLRPPQCGVLRRPVEDDRVDRADHLLLHDLVLLDGDMPDAGNTLDVDVLQRALEPVASRYGRARTVGDIEIDVFADAAIEAGAKYRIKADCQFDGRSEFVQA